MTRNFLLRNAAETWESVCSLVFPPCCCLCLEPTLLGPTPMQGELVSQSPIDSESQVPSAHGDVRLYPPFCRTCETSIAHSRPQMRTACADCGFPTGALPSRAPHLPCPQCARRERPHTFSRVTPLYRYQDAVTTAVVAAKYPRNSAITFELARRLAKASLDRWPDLVATGTESRSPLVTSVPSPWRRQVRRGGSGTRLLGELFAKQLGLEYKNLLKTTRAIAKQAWLDDEARQTNVRNAFAVRRGSWRWKGVWRWGGPWRRVSTIRDRTIILVDDVMTTGATADEVSRVLLDAGAQSVSLAVVALAIRES